MIIECRSCKAQLEVPDEISDGQHIICPYCNCKFSYTKERNMQNPPKASGVSPNTKIHFKKNNIGSIRRLDSDMVVSNDKSGTVRNIIVAAVLAAAVVFGLVQYRKFERRQAYEDQLRMDRERAEAARAAAERAAELEHERKEAEEREQRLRREREAEDARLEQERLEERRRAREESEAKRREIEKISAAQENYRRVREAFGLATTYFYLDVMKDSSSGNATGVVCYVDESFSRDGRIYEIKNGVEVWVIYPDKLPEKAPDGFAIPSPESRAGLLVKGGKVIICGVARNTGRYPVPDRGKAFVPYEADLGKLLDITLALGINTPDKRYHVTLQKKNGERVCDLGICSADDVVSWESIEAPVRDVLERRLKRSAKAIKPPVPKKMRRTVVFYDGGITKKDISGLIHIPREFQYHYHGNINYEVRQRAREDWERLRDIAVREDEEELKIAAENSFAQKEFERKAREMNMEVVEESAVDKYLADCELIVERGKKKSAEKKIKRGGQTGQKTSGPVKCYKCRGQGSVKTAVLEPCDGCGGQGVITHEIELENSHHVGDRSRTKKSKAGFDCPKCKRRGRIRIERDVECPVCHGKGAL